MESFGFPLEEIRLMRFYFGVKKFRFILYYGIYGGAGGKFLSKEKYLGELSHETYLPNQRFGLGLQRLLYQKINA